MLAEILEPVTTKQGTLTPGQLIELSSFAVQRLSGKVRPINVSQKPIVRLSQWQQDFCMAHAEFNGWPGSCPRSIEDCLVSRILDSAGKLNRLRNVEIGQGVSTDDVVNWLLEANEPVNSLLGNPVWLICLAESCNHEKNK